MTVLVDTRRDAPPYGPVVRVWDGTEAEADQDEEVRKLLAAGRLEADALQDAEYQLRMAHKAELAGALEHTLRQFLRENPTDLIAVLWAFDDAKGRARAVWTDERAAS